MGLGEKQKEIALKIKTAVKKALKATADFFRVMFRTLSKVAEKSFVKIREVLKSLAEKIYPAAKALLENMKKLPGGIKALCLKIKEKLSGLEFKLIKRLWSGTKRAAGKFAAGVKKLPGSIKALCLKIKEKLSGLEFRLIKRLWSGTKRTAGKFAAGMKKLPGRIKAFAAAHKSKIKPREKSKAKGEKRQRREKTFTAQQCICTVVTLFLVFLLAVIVTGLNWMMKTWANLTIDEIIFHLKVPLTGTGSDIISDFFSSCMPSVLAAVLIVAVLFVLFRSNRKPYYFMAVGAVTISLTVAASTVSVVYEELDIGGYIENQRTNSMFIQDNFVDPRTTEISFPEKKQNLIYIYLESMESTYADVESGGGFEVNCIPELTQLAEENINFSNSDKLGGAYSSVGATWTMGAMFADTSGLPLKLPIEDNSMSEQETFFPDIVTLGDILESEGYNQYLMIGSDAAFGGRKNYFTQHGDFDIFDYYSGREYLGDYWVWWGFEDEKLFSFAKDSLNEISKDDEPFNFTMLTVDTHFSDGYYCELCRDEFEFELDEDSQYADVMACSSRQVSEFVSWIQEQDFYENTTIVLCGDHLTMDGSFWHNADASYRRTIYNAFINSQIGSEYTKNRAFTDMDMFPTTLAALGAEIKGEKLGLGVNLFSGEPTLAERYGIDTLNAELAKKSTFFDSFTKDIVIPESSEENE